MAFWAYSFGVGMGMGDVPTVTNQSIWYYYANTRAVQ